MKYFLPHTQLQALIDILKQAHYAVIGPQVKEGAITYASLEEVSQLPWGIRDHQEPGRYHLEKIKEHEAFSWANGPQALKPLLFKASETVWKVLRDNEGKLVFSPTLNEEQPIAVLGVRACDLAALAIQDKVFMGGEHIDTRYAQRRKNLFIIAVICTYSSNNCFCVSAGTGPRAESGYDVKMTEIPEGFVVSTGSDKGRTIINSLKLKIASSQDNETAKKRVDQASNTQTKKIPFNNSKELRDVLFNNLDHERWKEVAERCLSCGNCTQVCPTCFCHKETEEPSLDGSCSEHLRAWDSCFTAGHSYIGGHPIRDDTQKRYRQWLTHKVGSWHDQFGSSGCVGCGRCISWCPVGIDITEELVAITGEPHDK